MRQSDDQRAVGGKYAVQGSGHNEFGFIGRFAAVQSLIIRTKGEVARILQTYGMDELSFADVRVADRYDKAVRTYDVNTFIVDEIRRDEDKKFLILTFTATDRDDYLLWDKISFLISEIQLIYAEYRCVGELL
jgi:hypothetical protein